MLKQVKPQTKELQIENFKLMKAANELSKTVTGSSAVDMSYSRWKGMKSARYDRSKSNHKRNKSLIKTKSLGKLFKMN